MIDRARREGGGFDRSRPDEGRRDKKRSEESLFVVVGSGAGGGYDVYARSLARSWSRHIPGNPTIVIQNMPGAGGITMMH